MMGKRNKNGYLFNVFECFVCNCGFVFEEEVFLYIEFCIVNLSNNDGGGDVVNLGFVDDIENKCGLMNKLEVCVGMYFLGNLLEGLVEIVLRLLRNIVKELENFKFRRIRMSNSKIREVVGEVVGGIEFLEYVGFEFKEEGEMWVVMDIFFEDIILILKELIRLMELRKKDEVLLFIIFLVKVVEKELKIIDR